MSENTTVGPEGANKAPLGAKKPDNHTTSARDGRFGAKSINAVPKGGAPSSDVTLTKTGNPVNKGGT